VKTEAVIAAKVACSDFAMRCERPSPPEPPENTQPVPECKRNYTISNQVFVFGRRLPLPMATTRIQLNPKWRCSCRIPVLYFTEETPIRVPS
jgi:hypothetical protein